MLGQDSQLGSEIWSFESLQVERSIYFGDKVLLSLL